MASVDNSTHVHTLKRLYLLHIAEATALLEPRLTNFHQVRLGMVQRDLVSAGPSRSPCCTIGASILPGGLRLLPLVIVQLLTTHLPLQPSIGIAVEDDRGSG